MIGHEWAVRMLTHHITNNCVGHAYLITGPHGVGRRTLAIKFAQSLNCPQPTQPGVACFQCQSCQQIARMEHPDMTIISAPQRGSQIRIEQIREMQRSIYLTPFIANYRIVLLLRFEEANQNAANALLKALEEPPEKVVLILTAECPEVLLPTIVSRCERIPLHPISLNRLSEKLQELFNITYEQANLLAHISGGYPGNAIRFLQNPNELEQRKNRSDEFINLLTAKLIERFTYAEKISKDKPQIISNLELWQSLWRDLLIISTRSTSPIINLDYQKTLTDFAQHIDRHTAYQVIGKIKHTQSLIERNINPRLAMEILLIDLPHL